MHLSIFFTMSSLLSFHVAFVLTGAGGENPFTPKSYVIRYWNNKVSNNLPKPSFLIDKASPLTAADNAVFSKLAGDRSSLSDHLPDFCAKANLFCLVDSSPNLKSHDAAGVHSFAKYEDKNFTNYGKGRVGGADSFRTYSHEFGGDSNRFRRYSRGSVAEDDTFATYAEKKNMPHQSFSGYGTVSVGGEGEFSGYNEGVNVPDLHFAASSDGTEGRTQTFTAYATGGNSGSEEFTGYGRNSDGAANQFTGYAANSNVIASDFNNYAPFGNGGNDSFASYGTVTNTPQNTFRSYATGSNGAAEKFDNYRIQSTEGNDEFHSYGKKSNGGKLDFEKYGSTEALSGASKFTGYGQNAASQDVDFKLYGLNRTFKQYANKGVTFSDYLNQSSSSSSSAATAASFSGKGKMVNKWVVESGKFFREKMLENGTIMQMPDIRDKTPKRSFLPRTIVSKLPLLTSKIMELQTIFHAGGDSNMAKMLNNSLKECERSPNRDETKQCVASIEDMIDFVISILGRNITVHATKSTRGYNSIIMIGQVKGINGGKVTKSVSCHQTLFPYMVYYCHSVPKVRVYEAEILDLKSRARINNGVAICHLDTTAWSAGHGAFLALGPGPGKIEVCHWIFENDMTWTVAD